MGRHIYTFENICKEDKSVLLKDETTKIFLNAKGTMDDIRPELKAFLDDVAGKKPADPFVDELEAAVKNARKNREWRHEYMTLLMRDQENIEKGMEIGTARGIIETGIDFGLSEEELLKIYYGTAILSSVFKVGEWLCLFFRMFTQFAFRIFQDTLWRIQL